VTRRTRPGFEGNKVHEPGSIACHNLGATRARSTGENRTLNGMGSHQDAASKVPNLDVAIVGSGHGKPPSRQARDTADAPVMRVADMERRRGIEIPHAYRMVVRPGYQQPAVGEGNGVGPRGVASKGTDLGSRFEAPQLQNGAFGGSHGKASVMCNGDRSGPLPGKRYSQDLLRGLHIPNADGPVIPAGDHSCATPCHRHTAHSIVMAGEALDLVLSGEFPERKRACASGQYHLLPSGVQANTQWC